MAFQPVCIERSGYTRRSAVQEGEGVLCDEFAAVLGFHQRHPGRRSSRPQNQGAGCRQPLMRSSGRRMRRCPLCVRSPATQQAVPTARSMCRARARNTPRPLRACAPSAAAAGSRTMIHSSQVELIFKTVNSSRDASGHLVKGKSRGPDGELLLAEFAEACIRLACLTCPADLPSKSCPIPSP